MPLLLLGLVVLLKGEHRRAAMVGGAAVALGLTTWGLVVEPNEIVPPATGLSGLFVGYYLWLASMATLVIGSVAAGATRRTSVRPPESAR
jgi:hypothetical protein